MHASIDRCRAWGYPISKKKKISPTHPRSTTGNHFFAVRRICTAKTSRNTVKSLPCQIAQQTVHGLIYVGKGLRRMLYPNKHGTHFAVCLPRAARQTLCRVPSSHCTAHLCRFAVRPARRCTAYLAALPCAQRGASRHRGCGHKKNPRPPQGRAGGARGRGWRLTGVSGARAAVLETR